MEMQEENKDNMQAWMDEFERRHYRGKILAGIFVVAIGTLLLARQMGALIPEWVFTWKMLLIAIGVFIGAKRAFKPGGWVIPIIIGGIFITSDLMPDTSIRSYLWPLFFIALGLFIIFKPRNRNCGPYNQWRRNRWERWEKYAQSTPAEASPENRVEIIAVFAGVKKNIISKTFAGGEIVSVFGGTELNLIQSDIEGTVVLDAVQVFGGTKLIIPQHWQVKSEMVSVFGGVEDKRPIVPESTINNDKVLLIRGTCFFGGLELTCY